MAWGSIRINSHPALQVAKFVPTAQEAQQVMVSVIIAQHAVTRGAQFDETFLRTRHRNFIYLGVVSLAVILTFQAWLGGIVGRVSPLCQKVNFFSAGSMDF